MKNSDVGLRPNIQAQATFAKSYCPQKLKFAQKKPQAGPIPSNFWCAIQKKSCVQLGGSTLLTHPNHSRPPRNDETDDSLFATAN